MVCNVPSNTIAFDETKFWDEDGMHWDAHRIGWTIAGGCTSMTVLVSLVSVLQHCRNYTKPRQQRQILRILYMPPIYAVVSFFSYRFYRNYVYYSLVQEAYEAVTLTAFLFLIIEYVSATATGYSTEKALERKNKTPLPIPFCCLRYRPTKAYFMYTLKWSVLQYVLVRPVASIAGIICEKLDILCEADGFSFRSASAYLEVITFISITIALYGLLVFYDLAHDELENRRPMAKFLSIKLILMFTFYQSFAFKLLEGRVIHATAYWTEANIANGLNSMTICVEMVFFAALMWWAYPATEYKRDEYEPKTRPWRPLWDSINYADFGREIIRSLKFFIRGKPPTPLSHRLGPRANSQFMELKNMSETRQQSFGS